MSNKSKLVVSGLIGKTEAHSIEHEDIILKRSINMVGNRGGGTDIVVPYNDDDIVGLVFEDGAEWFGNVNDVHEIYNQPPRRGEDKGEYRLPMALQSSRQRGLGSILSKTFNLFEVKDIPERLSKILGKQFDEKVMPNPGLYQLNSDFELHDFLEKESDKQHYLLFIHGTASSTSGSFKGLHDERDLKIWEYINDVYGSNVLALQHRTVSVDPFENALVVLEKLPSNVTLDIISHSRGGIIADIISRYDARCESIGFDAQEVKILEKEEGIKIDTLQRLRDLAIKKQFKVNKTIRVACPARGTILMSDRLDHFLNGLLRTIGMAFGSEANFLYDQVKTFLLKVIKTRQSPYSFPGLRCMIPDSPFQKILNNPFHVVKSKLLVIEGNSEIGGSLKQSILVIFSNLFYWKANDFVVNTDSMRYGTPRISGTYIFPSKTKKTNHFNYFKNKNTQGAIHNAISWKTEDSPKGYHFIPADSGQRGVALSMVDYGDVVVKEPSGQKPILILIPGIMGSNLSFNEDKIWVDFHNIYKGRMVSQMSKMGNQVTSNSIVGKFYRKIVQELEATGYDVRILPFDWRKSLDIAAETLRKKVEEYRQEHKQTIKILAHSMGGLVVRNWMMRQAKSWEEYINDPGSKFIMLGTPWKGSYAIMEVLTGYARRIRQLAALDFKHDKGDWTNLVQKYEGVYQLLPIDDEKLENQSTWDAIRKQLRKRKQFQSPSRQMLTAFGEYKEDVQKFIKNLDENADEKLKNTIYVAGFQKATTEDYTIKSSWFGNTLKFVSTAEGDGSVTWASGIPEHLEEEHVYYTRTGHGELANDSDLFPGIIDLLNTGKTHHFRKSPPPVQYYSRGEGISAVGGSEDHSEIMDIVFGVEGRDKSLDSTGETIIVQVSHGDLRASTYPLMVGHFQGDGIVSAENALNMAIGGKLEERRQLGKYPGKIGDNLVLYNEHMSPKGAIVIGLGDSDELTGFNLAKTVEQGIIDYILHMRDNVFAYNNGGKIEGITSLCIGSGFGRLPLESSLSAILLGIRQANEKLRNIDADSPIIKYVEFIELYANKARNAYYSLTHIASQDTTLQINLNTRIEEKLGGRKKLDYKRDADWWHQFTTEKIIPKRKKDGLPALRFSSSSGISRVERKDNFASEKLVNSLLDEMSQNPVHDPELSKTLFDLVIPNAFKEIIRNENNILWKLDINTAAFPWELFHDAAYNPVPTFTKAGLIRQLITTKYREKPRVIRNQRALIIGDPLYKSLPQLPAAKEEAEVVNETLKLAGFETTPEIGKRTSELIKRIFNDTYKILHVAGHGVVHKNPRKTGIELGGQILTPQDLDQLPQIPEFVFINCCYSGTVVPSREELYERRYAFAANIGTQLIKMGVQAVVVTGWAVDDDAAKIFAQTLYKRLIEGYRFGAAVKRARSTCYKLKPNSVTWAAYQCYGDPYYRLVKNWSGTSNNLDFISIDEIVIELDNIIQDTRKMHKSKVEKLLGRMDSIISRAKNTNLDVAPEVIEKQAEIYMEVDEVDQALSKYRELFTKDRASYTVKSLERFCNLLAKQYALNDIKENKTSREAIINQFDSLLLIGKTHERLNLFGSAYKRIAYKEKNKKVWIEKMRDKYYEAYLLVEDKSPLQYCYSLTNYLTASRFISPPEKLEVLFQRKYEPPTVVLEKIEGKLRKITADHTNFWEDIALVNILLCKMLYIEEGIDELRDEIIRYYKNVWNLGGNYRNLRTEIEHLNFLIALVMKEKNKDNLKRALEEIRDDLTEIMNNK